MSDSAPDDAALRDAMHRVRTEIGKAVVGQDGTVTGLLIALLARGHVLLEGVPGVAKTLLVRAFSRSLGLDTKRIQFTPDLMPGDVSGSLVYDARTGEFEFRAGPVFTHVVLADEINRTPPKTQAALLEAMEERQVSTDGVTRPLPEPFLVAATQNPIEHEGTYLLPEAQLDRFLLKLVVEVPGRDAELAVLRRHADGFDPRALEAAGVEQTVTPSEILAAQRAAAAVTVADDVLGYIVDLARATRESPSVQLGVSPRATTALLAAAKAWAWLSGYPAITPDHVQTMLVPTWRHRIRLRPDAEIEGVSVDAILTSIQQQTRVPL
ncbi:AAA family ATPase [Microbacterium sp. dk485]|uniref:AAA family ATPase n=1 Tax=Microbacterium sp. dk485 TaxID=2560021 RepID=UPI00107404B1|nr:AAA family ATPase [Microbacterium sp. dk485]TFV83756.1 AAA family ATPase [Microbacterium sp. dk485]